MNEHTLNADEAEDLRCLAGMIIPPSARHCVPGADDAAIQADILRSLGRDTGHVRSALGRLRSLAGGALVDLDASRRAEVAQALRAERRPDVAVLTRIILLCYYRDDRVMVSLGMEPRPPFPKGHVVEQGDWSLLDPVRARAPFWRPLKAGLDG